MPVKLIILDRDGVINEDSDAFIKSVDEFIPIPGSILAIAKFKQAGFLVAIASNQSGIARGLFTFDTLQVMHLKLSNLLKTEGVAIDYIAVCPHGPDDHCQCRKPKPGLLIEICSALQLQPEEAVFVGDSYRDYEAAKALNMPFVLVKTGKGMRTLTQHPALKQEIQIFDDLLSFSHEVPLAIA